MADKETNHDKKETIEKKLPIRMTSKVVRGFGRGSSDLGIPTANMDCDNAVLIMTYGHQGQGNNNNNTKSCAVEDLPCGIYWGFCRVGDKPNETEDSSSSGTSTNTSTSTNSSNSSKGITFQTAVSIGYNPHFGNTKKTVEPHLIACTSDPRRHASSCGETVLENLYDEPCRLSVVGYLRPELPFEGLEKLIEAIKNDIVNAENLANDNNNTIATKEKEWCESNVQLIQ